MTGSVGTKAPVVPEAAGLTATEGSLVVIAGEVFDWDTIRPHDDLFDLGVASLDFIKLLVRINEEFGVAFTGAELGDDASLAHLANLIDEETPDPA